MFILKSVQVKPTVVTRIALSHYTVLPDLKNKQKKSNPKSDKKCKSVQFAEVICDHHLDNRKQSMCQSVSRCVHMLTHCKIKETKTKKNKNKNVML